MITRNIFVIGWLTTCVVVVLLIQGYVNLSPIIFIVGLVGVALVAGWKSLRVDTRALVIYVIISIIVAVFDEYAHTSTGVLTYFDSGTPSFLTVMGWPLFILTIIFLAEFIENQAFKKLENRWLSLLVPLIAIVLIPVLVILQGYASRFDLLLVGVYCFLGLISLVYASNQKAGWNLSILISAVIVGAAMEVLGAMEGLWFYGSGDIFAGFMALIWVLRTWTILAITSFLKVTFTDSRQGWVVWLRSNPLKDISNPQTGDT